MNKDKLILCGLLLTSIMVFFFIGVYDTFFNVPAKNAKIAGLTDQRDTWHARCKYLEKYIEDREGKYRVAVKFDHLFMLAADPNQVMDFEAIEELIKDRKDCYKKHGK